MRPAAQLSRPHAPLCAVPVPVRLPAPGSARGQTTLPVPGGASLAPPGGSDVSSADSRAGIRDGASAVLPLRTHLDLQPGAAHAAKGATRQGIGVDVEPRLGYPALPLLLRSEPSVAGAISPHFRVGPAPALRVSCNAAATAGGVKISIDCDGELDDLGSMDPGAMAGAGIDSATSGSRPVSVAAPCNLDLPSNSKSDDANNRAFSIMAGIAFPTGWQDHSSSRSRTQPPDRRREVAPEWPCPTIGISEVTPDGRDRKPLPGKGGTHRWTIARER